VEAPVTDQTRAVGIILLTMAMCARSEAADLGKFTRPSSETTVDFYDCGGNLCGKIVAVDDKSDTETIGKLIVDGAKPAGNGIWKGDLIDVESGKRYAGTITLSDSGLKLEGCFMMVLCGSEVWQRARQ
jgi:uncharacterized protein (DUF2147 family)